MDSAAHGPWRSSLGTAAAVAVAGAGVLSLLAMVVEVPSGLPTWKDFYSTTFGDSIFLPLLFGSLAWGVRTLPSAPARGGVFAAVGGGIVGALVGIGTQISWYLDPTPRLTWVLPKAHHFSSIGVYHAIFLVGCSVIGAAMFALLALRLVHLHAQGGASSIAPAASSVWLTTTLAASLAFTTTLVLDGGEGQSRIATALAVLVPCCTLFGAVAAFFGRPAFRSLAWAAITGGSLGVLPALLDGSVLDWIALVVGISVSFAIALSFGLTPGLAARSLYLAAPFVAFALAGRESLLEGWPLVAGGLAAAALTLVVILPRAMPWIPERTVSFLSVEAAAAVAVLATIPLSAWMFARISDEPLYGTLFTLVYSILAGPFFMPALLRADMAHLLRAEADSHGVTRDPDLSRLALTYTLKALGWGTAAIVGLLTIVISAGPSMGFIEHGGALPPSALSVAACMCCVALAGLGGAIVFRRRAWSPAVVVVAAVGATSIAARSAGWLDGSAANVLLAAFTALVFLWTLDSVVLNVGMRASWVARRPWRLPVALGVATSLAAIFAWSISSGSASLQGGRPSLLASFGVFIAGSLASALILAAAAIALECPRLQAECRRTESGSVLAPDWARYRLSGSLLQDFGLLLMLTALGMWLPIATLQRIGPTTPLLGAVLFAMTGGIVFSFILFEALRNSVSHVGEQSVKAEREFRTWFFGLLPKVEPKEERRALKYALAEAEGPVPQKDWVALLAAHQLHQNLIVLATATATAAGIAALLSDIRGGHPGALFASGSPASGSDRDATRGSTSDAVVD